MSVQATDLEEKDLEENDVNDTTEAWMRRVLRAPKTVWTPECPPPDTLLDWIEQEDAHSQAAAILAHFITCAYCRQQHVALLRIRALARDTEPNPSNLPANIRAWVSEIVNKSILAPVEALSAAFEQMKQLMAPLAGPQFALTQERSDATLHPLQNGETMLRPLRPALTAVRSLRPTLQWEGDEMAQEVEVTILHSDGRRWQSRAPAALPFAVPNEAGLEPGSLYKWQVTARSDEDYEPLISPTAAFIVLSEAMAQQVTELERAAGEDVLARVSLYEAHGLYDDALQTLKDLPPADRNETTTRLEDKLLQRLQQCLQ